MSEASIILLQDNSSSVINFSLKVRVVLISSAFFFLFMSQEIHIISTSPFNYLHITQSKSDFCKKQNPPATSEKPENEERALHFKPQNLLLAEHQSIQQTVNTALFISDLRGINKSFSG